MMPVEDGAFVKLKQVNEQSFEAWWSGLTCGPKARNEYMVAWNVFAQMPSRYTVNKQIKLVGIPKMTSEGRACFHSLRHSFTTTIARMTKDVRLAQRMADHADITTTQGYLHTEQSEHAAVTREFPTVREGSERAVKRAVVGGKTGQIESIEVPVKSNENGTQMTTNESFSAVEFYLVQGREIMEPGGIEPYRNQALQLRQQGRAQKCAQTICMTPYCRNSSQRGHHSPTKHAA